ncbi:betaine--homocysteine S-methyltransferase 1-like [Saccostrea echinata]|uniref:betaine--homocysteine S-methyltransferase 1-like n=1 Tax=Saccostrea echinata TaxID=191078 RepID=UPI002A7FA45D|nr:betaine--homocysteine S-methyltransferase 1-like [Saccostrea echinata]
MSKRGLVERLKNGENVLIANGYMWEFARRGYLTLGGYVPEVVIEHPELVTQLHEEFVHAGTDVLPAFTYFGHREKMRSIGREAEVESLNRQALRIARKAADQTGCLVAGSVCHTQVYSVNDPETHEKSRAIFKEVIEWAVEEGADYIVGETFSIFEEAKLALECIKLYGKGLPAVITLSAHIPDQTVDDVPIPEACRRLEEAGAVAVGLNCSRGPKTMIPLIREIRKVCKGPIAAIPVPFRCKDDCRTFYSFKDEETGKFLYPNNLECKKCSSDDIREFATAAKEIGVQYVGLCCGNCAAYMRDLAEVYGRTPEASRYSCDLSLSFVWGEKKALNKVADKEFMYMVYGTEK